MAILHRSKNKSTFFGHPAKSQQPSPEGIAEQRPGKLTPPDTAASKAAQDRSGAATVDLSPTTTGITRFLPQSFKERRHPSNSTDRQRKLCTSPNGKNTVQFASPIGHSGVRHMSAESPRPDRDNLRKSVAFPLQQTDSSPSSHHLRRNLSSRSEETTATPRSAIGPSRLQELKVEDKILPEAVEQALSSTNNKIQPSSHSNSLKNSGSILRKPQYPVGSQEEMPSPNNESSAQPSKPSGEASPVAKDRSFALPFHKEVSNSAAAVQNNIASAIHQHQNTDSSTSKKQSPTSAGNLEKAIQKDSEQQLPVLQFNETSKEDQTRELAQLQSKLDELDAENTKLRALYHGEQDRVYNLQNAMASQKLASSHTVLDDSQYERMFKSLDDSINDVSYQIRKDWVSIPSWLKDYIHEDATTAGTKEMIAVGRALISRFVHDEIFQRYLHPGIYEPLSKHLKRIDLNLRSLHMNPGTTQENREAGAAYISSWRAATMEGLSGLVQRDGQANKAKLAKDLTNDFLQRMMVFLKSPAPQILEGGVQSIVDLALDLVEFKCHESRDIQTQYFLPNQEIDLGLMTKDMSLPLLSTATNGESKKQSSKEATPSDEQRINSKKKRSTLSTIRMKMHGTKELQSRPYTSVAHPPEYAQEHDPLANRMRFSAFFAVAVFTNGNMRVLYKAPVFPFVAE